MAIPKFKAALYRMKRILGRPVVLIGVTATSYDRQNRTATITHSRVRITRAIVTPEYQTLTDMLGKNVGGSVNKAKCFVIVDISDTPVTFDRNKVTYIQIDGITYNVDMAETIEFDKAMSYRLVGVEKDYRFVLSEVVTQSVSVAQVVAGVIA